MSEILDFKIFEGINQNTGEPKFPIDQTIQEVNAKVQNFQDNETIFGSQPDQFTDTLSYSSDLMVVKQTGGSANVTSYESYTKIDDFYNLLLLEYNYNMSTASVDIVFSRVLDNITKELTPPKSSRTFAYDFKFCQNRNGSIVTGSARPVSTRTTRSSGGGGY